MALNVREKTTRSKQIRALTFESAESSISRRSLRSFLGRGAEILVSLIGLVVLSPLFIVVSVMVKLNSPGPVFYRGTRVGIGNSVYRLIKFRTLPVQYETSVGDRILTQKERISGLFASLVVRSKLDELPQLINVLRGDMSLVGPRPVRPIIYQKYSREITGYAKKFSVKPGISGLAQIVGGYYMAPALKHKYDMLYIQHRSTALDIKLILLTFIVLVFSRRMMKWPIIESFLGFKLDVRSEEIEPTEEQYNHVTGAH